jgi:hypothetical protein
MISTQWQPPTANELIRTIQDALEEVENSPTLRQRDGWTNAIADAISSRLGNYKGVECCYGRDRKKPADTREWLFDYCALFYEEPTNVLRFVAQALIIGEMEFSDQRGLDTDFEKLLIADSLVCLFCFQGWVENDIAEKLTKFQELAQRRQRYAIQRGVTTPPIFVLACYSNEKNRFILRIIQAADHAAALA